MFDSGSKRFWCAVLLGCLCTTALAQQRAAKDYPSKPIRLLVPYAPGGGIDFVGYTLGQKIGSSIGHHLFIDNRAGAGGAIGTDVAAKSARDGYTILLTSSAHASLPSIMKSLPYDAVKDFMPITLIANSAGFVLVVHPSVPARSVKELIALAKRQPGKLNYGSSGVGGVIQFATEAFNVMAGTQLTHVPYKGVGQGIIDLLAGRVDLIISPGTVALPHIRAGKLRALGLTATARWADLPDVPTIDEAGLKGYSYVVWYGMWFPAGTPAEYVPRIRAEVVKAFEDPEIRRSFAEQGYVPVVSTPQEFSKTILDDIAFHRKLVQQIGLTPQ
jgi:tripartite-type tricarboxylate transporter receptor subunit TctC